MKIAMSISNRITRTKFQGKYELDVFKEKQGEKWMAYSKQK